MPSVLELFRNAIAGGHNTQDADPLQVAQTIGRVAGAVRAYSDERSQMILTNVLLPWAADIAVQAPTRWLLPANVPPRCCQEDRNTVCELFAVGGCHICGRPVCLGHALVSSDATLVCWTCVRLARQYAKPWKPPVGAATGGSAENLAWAYDLLGVTEDSSEKELKSAFKKKVAEFHPDTAPKGNDGKSRGDLVRALKRAYDVLLEHRKTRDKKP
jgi:hypothetical protein